METDENFEVLPLTSSRWLDIEQLFGTRGAYGGCWCMWWRLTRKEFEQGQGDCNRDAFKSIVKSGEIPGIIAYLDGKPVAWCSVAPRATYGSLNRSKVLKQIDDLPVWSLVCLFVARKYRDRGIIRKLLHGVIEYVSGQGGKIIEAYPTIPKSKYLPPVSSFMGLPSMFAKAGFIECAHPSRSRMIMRYYIN